MGEFVQYEVADRIAIITLNRPDQMNALNREMMQELMDAFIDVRDNPDVWVGILTANGKAFSSGHDLKAFGGSSGGKPKGPSAYDMYSLLPRIFKPLISAINGICLAQGAALALGTDIRIAAEGVQFGWPQVKRGIGSVSGPTLLARSVPVNLALETLFTGEFISAQRALALGMLNAVVHPAELMPTAVAMAHRILANAPLAVRAMKESTMLTREMPPDDAFLVAKGICDRLVLTQDAQEGLAAFREKREPVWKCR